jgi:hypothetical protein
MAEAESSVGGTQVSLEPTETGTEVTGTGVVVASYASTTATGENAPYHPENDREKLFEELGWVEWVADESGDDLRGMEDECRKALEVARARCIEKNVKCDPPLKFAD